MVSTIIMRTFLPSNYFLHTIHMNDNRNYSIVHTYILIKMFAAIIPLYSQILGVFGDRFKLNNIVIGKLCTKWFIEKSTLLIELCIFLSFWILLLLSLRFRLRVLESWEGLQLCIFHFLSVPREELECESLTSYFLTNSVIIR